MSDAGLRAPEAQLGTSPLTIAFLNGMNSLIRFGLTECYSGFGPWWNKPQGGAFPDINRDCWARAADTSDGNLTFAVIGGESPATTGATVVAELDVLLTAGRLTIANRHMIATAYDDIVTGTTSACNACKAGGGDGGVSLVGGKCHAWCSNSGYCGTASAYKGSGSTDCRSDGATGATDHSSWNISPRSQALRRAIMLIISSAEFHATNIHASFPSNAVREVEAEVPSLGRKYKAIVVLYLAGGADSFNMLAPHSGCVKTPAGDTLDAEYMKIRGAAALTKAKMRSVSTGGANVVGHTQPCANFGLHNTFVDVQRMYKAGNAAFFANVGTMVEPMTKQEYKDRMKKAPKSLFAHNVQTSLTQNVHAGAPSKTKGVLGRIMEALINRADKPYRAASYSLAGLSEVLEGVHQPNILNAWEGVVRHMLIQCSLRLWDVLIHAWGGGAYLHTLCILWHSPILYCTYMILLVFLR